MDLNVLLVTHAVSCQVVDMDVVLSEMLFVVQTVNIVVLKDIHVMCRKGRAHNVVKLQLFS